MRGLVPRFMHLRVNALDRHGNAIDEVLHGLTSGTYQHEVDHLRGKLFVDRVVDPHSFCTWQEFERNHKENFAIFAKSLGENP